MNKITKEEFIETYKPYKDVIYPVEITENNIFIKRFIQVLQAERGRFLQEKLADYDVGSLEYKIIESMLKED